MASSNNVMMIEFKYWREVNHYKKQKQESTKNWLIILLSIDFHSEKLKVSTLIWKWKERGKLIINWLELLTYLLHLRSRHLAWPQTHKPKMKRQFFSTSSNEISDPNQNPFKSKLINWIMGGVIDWLTVAHTYGRKTSPHLSTNGSILLKWITFRLRIPFLYCYTSWLNPLRTIFVVFFFSSSFVLRIPSDVSNAFCEIWD